MPVPPAPVAAQSKPASNNESLIVEPTTSMIDDDSVVAGAPFEEGPGYFDLSF